MSDNKINIYETPVSHSHDSHDNHNLKHIEISEYDNSYEGLYNEPEFKRYKSYNEEVIKDNNLNQNRHSNFINSKI